MSFNSTEKEATKVEGFEVGVPKSSYYVRLGSLSSKVRLRAYQQAVNTVRDAKVRSQETISQLNYTVNLVSVFLSPGFIRDFGILLRSFDACSSSHVALSTLSASSVLISA